MSNLIQIGNSQGVRIPKELIVQAGLLDAELTLKVVPEGLLICPAKKPRSGWAEAFRSANLDYEPETEDLELQNISNKFDEEDWEW